MIETSSGHLRHHRYVGNESSRYGVLCGTSFKMFQNFLYLINQHSAKQLANLKPLLFTSYSHRFEIDIILTSVASKSSGIDQPFVPCFAPCFVLFSQFANDLALRLIKDNRRVLEFERLITDYNEFVPQEDVTYCRRINLLK